MNGCFVREDTQIKCECSDVGRVQSLDSSFPEIEKVDHWFVNTGRACSGPKQVDTKPGDNEEKINAGVSEMNDVTGDFGQPPFPTGGRGPWRDAKRVICNDEQCRCDSGMGYAEHDALPFTKFARIGRPLAYFRSLKFR